MARFYIICALVLYITVGCNNYNYYKTSQGGDRPIKPTFKLAKPKPYILNNKLIDTNAIYISSFNLKYADVNKMVFRGIRFFSNGRFFLIYTDNPNDLNQYNFSNISAAKTIGYYCIENKNQIQLEDFGALKNYKNNKKLQYSYRRGYIQNDTITLFINLNENEEFPILKYRNNTVSNATLFIKKSIPNMTGKPDW